MKISREVKTAILVILGIVFFIFGFSYLKGNNLLNSTRTFYVEYDNVEGLAPSTPVTINGFNIGKVKSIRLKDDGSTKLLVSFVIESDFQFSKNSVAQLYEAGFISGKSIAIIPAFDNAESAIDQDYLTGTIKGGLTDLVQQKLSPLQEKVESAMVSADSLLTNLNAVFDSETKENLKSSIASLSQSMSSFKNSSQKINRLLADNTSKIDKTLSKMEYTSGNLSNLSDSLQAANIAQTIRELQSTFKKLDGVLAGIDNGEGSIGKLLKDEKLYDNLEGASKQMEALLEDMKLNPKRYVHFSLFGKKAKVYDAEGNEIKIKN